MSSEIQVRDFLDPAIDPLAFEIQDSIGTRATAVQQGVARAAFRSVGGAWLASSDDGERWAFPLPNEQGNAVVEFLDPAAMAAWLKGSAGAFYSFTGNKEPMWRVDTTATDIPKEIRTGYPESDGLVATTMALHHATRRLRWVGQNVARRVAPIRDRRALARHTPSTERTKAEIMSHYDHDQGFYVGDYGILGDVKLYSSGIVLPGQENITLEQKQEQKIESLFEMLRLDDAESLLEIGSGWGEFAIQTAKRYPHLQITSLTVSPEQTKRCREAAEAAGVADGIEFIERDYRDYEPGKKFDRVVSIEMIEAVPWQELPLYCGAIGDRFLKRGGIVALQAITVSQQQEPRQRHHEGFAQAIFPGGSLVSVETIAEEMERHGLGLFAKRDLTSSYGPTITDWRYNMYANEPTRTQTRLDAGISPEKSARSDRGFSFYLSVCDTGFRTRNIEDWQLAFKRD